MKKFFYAVLLVMTCIGCANSSSQRDIATVHVAQFPLYPFWTIAQMPGGPPSTSDVETISKLMRPTASAVLVTPGFLLTSLEGMGEIANDFLADPTVFVFDGAAWHRGRYIDRDFALHLALIRADVPGATMTLAKTATKPTATVQFPLLGGTHFAGTRTREIATPCDQEPRAMQAHWGNGRKFQLCVNGSVNELPGAAMLDANGALVGLQVQDAHKAQRIGPDVIAIREYLTTYFSSWGHLVRPRPTF